MTPVWMIEGGASALETPWTETDDAADQADGSAVRFAALADAVREHQSRRSHTAIPARPEDVALYRRLRQICGTEGGRR